LAIVIPGRWRRTMSPPAAGPTKPASSLPIRLLSLCSALLLAAILYNNVGGWQATQARRGNTLRPAALPLQRRALCSDPQFAMRPVCRATKEEDAVVVAGPMVGVLATSISKWRTQLQKMNRTQLAMVAREKASGKLAAGASAVTATATSMAAVAAAATAQAKAKVAEELDAVEPLAVADAAVDSRGQLAFRAQVDAQAALPEKEDLSCHARAGYDIAGDAAFVWGLSFHVA
jgi:hypothetical protein